MKVLKISETFTLIDIKNFKVKMHKFMSITRTLLFNSIDTF